MKRLLALLLVSCSAAVPAAFEGLWAGLEPGNYAVGFRSTGNTWYPATAGGELLRFRDYVPRLEDVDAMLHGHHISGATIVELFDTRMYARRDAPAIDQTFPVVHIALKERQTAAEHAVLAEYIASHGYVVAIGKSADAIVPEITTWDFAAAMFPEIGKAMPGQGRRQLASAARKTLQLISAETSRRPT